MEGKIVRWNDNRGFGFIESKSIKNDIFAHISDFKPGYRRPLNGDSVSFQIKTEKGKRKAVSISLVDVPPYRSNQRSFLSTIIIFSICAAIAFAIYTHFIKLQPTPAYEDMGFKCQGKTHCSQMTSCNEARFYLANCPNTQIDGNNDGQPCERQHCKSIW
ncbi:cold shock domain-containing protein [Gilvimarinus sp. 1_MG-2023]|uniref:cold shock domain-containing protein n=1 Tax=Gilvimarinus sp. 1_MG-2023 TaxID=3062638 RepID=UPI0026E3C1BC|nr:cold shock domain-containing protein [Gilvimarinus sp. 1_MG-2023]MDO6746462.1 cold shock domain-containing protein [Gilvimarinus sp. 1_MG-2023]